MKLIIYDGKKEELEKIFPEIDEDITIISKDKEIHKCIGCFGCWIKTPATCVIKDKYKDMGKLISKSEELIIISECFYGGYSPFVKNVIDRSISYIHPYFTMRNNEMHHRSRYDEQVKLRVYFYGEDITSDEKATAKEIVKANALNFNMKNFKVTFYKDIAKMRGDIL